MENTTENKANFFALYWGHMVLWHEETNTFSYVSHSLMTKQSVMVHSLLLTPLSQITDEHAIKIAEILHCDLPFSSDKRMLDLGKSVASEISKNLGLGCITWGMAVEIINFLRSKCYYIGDGTEVSFGYVKLKEGGQ